MEENNSKSVADSIKDAKDRYNSLHLQTRIYIGLIIVMILIVLFVHSVYTGTDRKSEASVADVSRAVVTALTSSEDGSVTGEDVAGDTVDPAASADTEGSADVEQGTEDMMIPEGMKQADDMDIKRVFNVNPEEYQGMLYLAPASNMDAAELLIARADDDSLAASLMDAINDRVSSQKKVFEGYAPDQYKLLNKSLAVRKGNFIIYSSAADTDACYKAFLGAL